MSLYFPLCICTFLFMSHYQFICLSDWLLVCLSFIHLSIYLSLSICLSFYLSIYLSVCLSVCVLICHLSITLHPIFWAVSSYLDKQEVTCYYGAQRFVTVFWKPAIEPYNFVISADMQLNIIPLSMSPPRRWSRRPSRSSWFRPLSSILSKAQIVTFYRPLSLQLSGTTQFSRRQSVT
jgi:hypothetical protein